MRLIDANGNRSREALRVIEDYARFVLDDSALQGDLKRLRHEISDALRPMLAEAILYRDTPNDVGTFIKTESEFSRSGLADVIAAAGKRLGEALRALEEATKTIDPDAARKLESARYRFYSIEQTVAMTLRATAGGAFARVRLYVLITEAICRRPWLEAAEQAILGGADCLQLREKSLDSGELLRRASQLVALCRKYDVIAIINDRPDIALLSGAHGVHVGQDDLPAGPVRRLLGSRLLVGVSTHNVEQGRQAIRDGADYIGVGPFFRSTTKPRDSIAGPEYARAAAALPIPSVAIAGITAANISEVLETGMRAVAVSSAIVGADDIRAAASEMKQKLTVAS